MLLGHQTVYRASPVSSQPMFQQLSSEGQSDLSKVTQQPEWMKEETRWPASQGRVLSALTFLGFVGPCCCECWTRSGYLDAASWVRQTGPK